MQTSHICGSPYLPTSDDWVLQGVPSDSSSKKTDEWVPAKTRYGRTVGRKNGAYDPSSGATIKWGDLVATEVEEDDIRVTSSITMRYWESMRMKSKYYKSSKTVFWSISMSEPGFVADLQTPMSYK